MIKKKYKICIISSQIAGFGKIGGFGSMTKKIAVTLANLGHDVSVVVPKRKEQEALTVVDNVKIYGLNRSEIFSSRIYKEIDADIYHSQNPNLMTYIAQKNQPQKKHVITCRDPRSKYDWVVEFVYATWKRRIKTFYVYPFEGSFIIKKAIQKADIVGVPANFLIEKVSKLYNRKDSKFFPNIENIPDEIPMKSENPTVVFVGRLDKRKRPEFVFKTAKDFPEVTFHIVGVAEDIKRQNKLMKMASELNNVVMHGYIDKFNSNELIEIYSKSWIYINTAAREGLPITFIEAASYGCAILSKVDPDNFASDFGYCADKDDFSEGLKLLLENNVYSKKGRFAYEYVKANYDKDYAIGKHIEAYDSLGI